MKIAEARGFLKERVLDNPDIPPTQKPAALIDRLDVSSPKDGAVFWSGDKHAAHKIARERGGTTMEGTTGGRVVDDWKQLEDYFPGWDRDPSPNGFDLWGGLSKKYASGVTGDVTVVQTPKKAALGGGDVWKMSERPTLKLLQKDGVVGIIKFLVI